MTEIVGHFAWDSRLEPQFPYPAEVMPYDADAFVDAIEREDQADAIALVRGTSKPERPMPIWNPPWRVPPWHITRTSDMP